MLIKEFALQGQVATCPYSANSFILEALVLNISHH